MFIVTGSSEFTYKTLIIKKAHLCIAKQVSAVKKLVYRQKTKDYNPECCLCCLFASRWAHIFACVHVLVGLASVPQKVGLRACYSSPTVWSLLARKHKLAEGQLL